MKQNKFGFEPADFEVLMGHVDYFDRKTQLEMLRESTCPLRACFIYFYRAGVGKYSLNE